MLGWDQEKWLRDRFRQGKARWTLASDSYTSVTFSPDERSLASGARDGSFLAWDGSDPSL